MQTDGDLVLYQPGDAGRALWASGTSGSVAGAILQTDGNFVIYSSGGAPLWNSKTQGQDTLYVQTDGNVVIYDTSGKPKWATWTGDAAHRLFMGEWLKPGQYLTSSATKFIMQTDGNLVAYYGSVVLWSSNTGGHSVVGVILQTDGNLVIYDTSYQAIWSSGTGGHADYLIDQNDDNVVIYSQGNQPLWWTNEFIMGCNVSGLNRGPNSGLFVAGWNAYAFNGYYGLGGIYSKIFEYSPGVVTGYSSAWVGLNYGDAPDGVGQYRYAKIGWTTQPGGVRNDFFEWSSDTDGSVWYQNLYGAWPPGSWHYYGVLVNYDGPGKVTFQVDGRTLPHGVVSANPVGTGYDTGEMWAETTNPRNQIAGGTRTNEVFAGSHVWQQDSCSCNQYASGWYDFGYGSVQQVYFPADNGPKWYDAIDSGGSSTSFEVFDRGCPK
ncbi:MAG: hypothetical protein JO198_02995 [Candidatus Dormibacteraeota bacterium]|nr:hypothetical protein [Candidatus Dormibacteraeota bacterium]